MTERKFTDEQIIKALECLAGAEGSCVGCIYQSTPFPTCRELVARQALDLINRQRAEIERLKAGKQSIKELADELCNRIGETGITDYNTYLRVAGLVQKVMGSPCTKGADCFAAEGRE